MATLNEAFDILDQLKANNDPRYALVRDSLQQQIDANAERIAEYRRLSYQSQPGPHWAGASSIGYAPPQIGYDTPKDTSIWGRIKDTASDAIQALPRSRWLGPLDPLIGGLQSAERANFGDHTWSGLQQLPHAAERTYDLINLQHLLRQSAVSPTTYGRSPGDSNLPVPPDMTWAPDGPLINRASFESMEPVVTPPTTPDGAPLQDWRLHRANRPALDNRRVDQEIQAQAPGLVANILQQGQNIEDIRERTRRESGDFSGGLQNIMGATSHLDVLKRVYENPEAAWATFGESLGYSLPTLVVSLLAGWASAPFRVLASSGVALPGAFATEMSFAAEEVLQQLGIDINNPEHVKMLMGDPSMMAAATNAMKTKASVIALFESLGIGASVKLGSLARHAKTLPRAAGYGVGGIGAQMLTEAGGEGFGTKLATGKTDMPGYMLEGLMGAGAGAIITIPTAMQGAFGGQTAQVKDVIRVLAKAKQKMVASGTIDQKQFTILSETQAALEDSQLSPREKAIVLRKLTDAANQGALNADIALDLGIDIESTIPEAREAGAATRLPEPSSTVVIDESTNIGSALEQRGQPTRQVPVAAETTPVSVFDADAILNSLQEEMGDVRVTRRMVKQRALELLGHEVQIHGALRAAFTALGLKTSDLDRFLNDIYSKYQSEIQAWLLTPIGRAYSGDAKTMQAEEWLANDLKAKSAKGQFARLLQRKLKQEANLDITGENIKELYDIIDALKRQSEGKATTIRPPARFDGETFEADTSGTRFAKGDPIDPSRRKFMKQVGGAVAGAAVDPSILLEPATQEAEVASRIPGSVYEFSIAVDPNAGWTSADDPAEGAIDVAFTHDPNTNEVMVYEGDEVVDEFVVDDMHADKEVLEYVRDKYGRVNINDARVQREEMERDPVTGEGGFDYWGDADQNFDNMARSVIRGEATMAGTEKVDRGSAYDIFEEPETPRVEEETVEKTDAELYVETIDEIMSIYDEDATAAEAAADGSLNDRIISYAAETPFTREELWEGVNQRIEALEDTGTRFAKRAADMTEAEKLNRDVRNDFAKGPYKEIIGREDEAEIRARIKRLGNLYGPMGQKRGIEPGDRATAKEQAQNAIDNVDAFEEFMAPFEVQMKAKPAKSRTAAGRREKYAERKGITVAEILSYRDRGKIHPMEKKMSYTFGTEEIDRLEAEGDITADEAETRRRTLNDLRNQLGGKMPPGAKRKATEIVYGIGDYANIEAWGYTEAETAGMEERAEVARGKERVRGLRRTEKTEKELEEIIGSDVTPTEMMQISAMREVEAFGRFTSDEARLIYLRDKEAMPASERRALDAFMRDMRGWDEAAYEAQLAAEREAQVKKVGVTRVKQTAAQRKAELKSMKEAQAPIEKRKHVQVEPDFFDTLEDPMFTIQGESIPDGYMELNEDGEWSEVDDTDTSTRYAKALGAPGEWVTHKVIGPGKVVSIDEVDTYIDFMNRKGVTRLRNDIGADLVEENTRSVDELEKEYAKAQAELDQDEAAAVDTSSKRSSAKMKAFNVLLAQLGIDKPISELSNKQLINIWKAWEKKDVGVLPYSVKRLILDRITQVEGTDYSNEFKSGARVLKLGTNIKWNKEHTYEQSGLLSSGLNTIKNLRFMPEFLNLKKASLATVKTEERFDEEAEILDDWFEAKFEAFDESNSLLDNLQNTLKLFVKKHPDIKVNKTTGETLEQTFVEKPINAQAADLGFVELLNDLDYITEGLVDFQDYASSLREYKFGEEFASVREQRKEDTKRQKENLERHIAEGFTRFAKRAKGESYEEHFNKNFWYTLTSYLWGKPVQAIRDFNKLSRFGQAKADVPAADEIADEIQRAHSSTQRAEPLIYGTDIVQDTSIRTGQFFTRLAQIFSRVTARLGDIETRENQMLVDILTGKVRIEELDNAEYREAAKLLRELMQDVYNYAKTETKGLKDPLDLRGHGDTLLPRVWNIEFLATRRGKAKFLKAIRAAISDPATGSSILEDADLTVEDLYNVVVNSGGFVQGDWTNLKADQTRSQKEIDRDIKAQEYLDALPTESLVDEDLVMIDLQAIIPRFIQKAVERTEYSKRFGVNDEILRAKIKEGLEQIKEHNAKVLKLDKTDKSLTYIDPKAFEKSVWDMARILRNKYGYDMANMQTRAWLQRVVNFEVVAKLPLVTLASMPELFTPMLRGSVRPDKFVVDLMAGFVWAGYKGMNGISKLLLNKHLPAMRKASAEIGGIGVVSDVQLLRELGIAEIQAMGDAVSTRYANPNFARGGLRAGARTTIAGRIPKKVRAVFNMQTYMQATLLTTLTEMQQLMALRNFQRHMAKRVKFVQKNAGKDLKGRRLRLFKQFSKDMADFGLPQNIDLSTAAGEAEFNAGAIRFVDQVITRPNDATTAKAFKNPLTAPIFLFKRFITTFGNTLMTAVGNDIATKVDNVEKAKQVGRIMAAVTAMYGAVMFAEIMRAAIKGDLDEDDMKIGGGDFRTFMRRIDRTGLLSAPGAMILNLAFPYKRGWWDSPEARIWGELGGPIGGDISQLMKTGFDRRPGSAQRLIRQMVPMSKQLIDLPPKKKRKSSKKITQNVTF